MVAETSSVVGAIVLGVTVLSGLEIVGIDVRRVLGRRLSNGHQYFGPLYHLLISRGSVPFVHHTIQAHGRRWSGCVGGWSRCILISLGPLFVASFLCGMPLLF